METYTESPGSFGSKIKRMFAFRESGVLLALVLLVVVLSLVSSSFRNPNNLITILKQICVVGVVAMGQTLVIIAGYFDLSQGPVAGLAAIVSAIAGARWGLPAGACFFIGLGIGVASGFFNGTLITRLRLHPVVVTLATSSIFMGLTYVSTQGVPVTGVPESFLWLGRGKIPIGSFDLPVPVLVMVVTAVIMHIVLTRFVFGRHIFIIGSNKEAARLSGVNPERVMLGIFILSGTLASLGGMITLGRAGSGSPLIGSDLLLPVVAASVIGGTLLSGGVGSMTGTIMGAAIMGVLRNALVVLRFDVFYQDIVLGCAVLAAVVIDQVRSGGLSFRSLFPGRR